MEYKHPFSPHIKCKSIINEADALRLCSHNGKLCSSTPRLDVIVHSRKPNAKAHTQPFTHSLTSSAHIRINISEVSLSQFLSFKLLLILCFIFVVFACSSRVAFCWLLLLVLALFCIAPQTHHPSNSFAPVDFLDFPI